MADTPSGPGTLYVVATPIGNLEDLTFRALRTLKEVDLIAAEDTRRTRKLLSHYGLATPMTSLHQHNEHREAPRLVERLRRGLSIAVVSDAGTPGISDPGGSLVRLAREAGVKVVPIPGPSAVTAALSVSGLAFDAFRFMGFPPTGGAARSDWLNRLAEEENVVVFFEAPHRISKTIRDVELAVGIRPIEVFRELTKTYETLVIKQNGEPVVSSQGEFVVVLGQVSEPSTSDCDPSSADDLFHRMTNSAELDEADAIAATAAVLGLKPSKVKSLVKKARYARLKDAP